MNLIGLLVILLVGCVVYWAAMKLLAAFGVGDPVKTVVLVILVVIFVVWLLQTIGGVNLGSWRVR
jgi:hypothetical protein